VVSVGQKPTTRVGCRTRGRACGGRRGDRPPV